MQKILVISVSVVAAALVVVACTSKADDEFGNIDGQPYEPPPEDTSEPDPVVDTADTADTADTGLDTADTGDAALDTADTADTGGGTTGPIEGSGYDVGDTAYNLETYDQNDNLWSLYNQKGKVVVLVLGDYLDGTFTYMADYLSEVDASYGVGVKIVAGLAYGADTAIADQADAAAIADTYDLSTVLYLDNPKDQVNWASARPVVYVIDKEMVIQHVAYGIVDQEDIEGWVDALR